MYVELMNLNQTDTKDQTSGLEQREVDKDRKVTCSKVRCLY